MPLDELESVVFKMHSEMVNRQDSVITEKVRKPFKSRKVFA